MEINNIGLVAQQSYSEIQNRPKLNITDSSSVNAAEFHSEVHRQFNKFAQMSPEQILNHIKNVKQSSNVSTISQNNFGSGIVGNTLHSMKTKLTTQEQVVRKSLIGEASLIEVLASTTEVKNNMDMMIKIKDKFLETFDKVINMNI